MVTFLQLNWLTEKDSACKLTFKILQQIMDWKCTNNIWNGAFHSDIRLLSAWIMFSFRQGWFTYERIQQNPLKHQHSDSTTLHPRWISAAQTSDAFWIPELDKCLCCSLLHILLMNSKQWNLILVQTRLKLDQNVIYGWVSFKWKHEETSKPMCWGGKRHYTSCTMKLGHCSCRCNRILT